MQVQDLLRQLRGGGELESAGQFTIDVEKATPKLERFLLSNPFHYGLKLVQAGVAAGAEEIHFQVGDRVVRVQLLGARIETVDVRQLFGYLLDVRGGRSSRAVRHLAVGINGMVSLGAATIRLECFDGEQRYRSVWKRGGQTTTDQFKLRWKRPYVEVEMLRSGKDAATSLYQKLHSDVFGLVNASREVLNREQATLVDRGFACPVPLRLNRRSLQRAYSCSLSQDAPPHWYADMARLEVPMQDDRASGLRLPPFKPGLLPDPFTPDETLRLPEEPVLAVLMLGTLWGDQSQLLVVEDGVLLAQETLYLGSPGLTAVMCGSLFTRDLTGLAVTRDEFYLRNVAALGRWAADLRQQVHRNWHAVRLEGRDPARLRPPKIVRALPHEPIYPGPASASRDWLA
jgi:hypothetical protein